MPVNRFLLDPENLVDTRFVLAPGLEFLRAVRRVAHPAHGVPLQRAMIERVEQRAPLSALRILASAIPRRGFIPDFLAQPGISDPRLLPAAIASTPPDVARVELAEAAESGARVPGEWSENPQAAVDALVRAWTDVWTSAFAEEWPVLERLLLADIAARSRLLASQGLAAVIDGLAPNVRWDRTDQSIVRSNSRWSITTRCEGRRLQLAPSVMTWPNGAIVSDEPWPVTLFYPAMNATEAASDLSGDPALAALIGTSRARILRFLRSPATSSEITGGLDLSPANVSHHLGVLRGAGLITTTNEGTARRHARTALADALDPR